MVTDILCDNETGIVDEGNSFFLCLLERCPFLAHVVQNRNLHNDEGESGVFRSARHLSAGSLSQWGYISLSVKEVFGFTLIPNDTAYGVGQDFAEGFSIKLSVDIPKAVFLVHGMLLVKAPLFFGKEELGLRNQGFLNPTFNDECPW